MALRIGELLEEGRRATSKAGFERWVTEDLPFGLDSARRFRAIFLAYRELPESTLKQMPRPWQALYALSSVPRPRLEQAISDGVVHAELTVEGAREVARDLKGVRRPKFSQVDVWAGRIVNLPVDELSPERRARLVAWLAECR